MWDERKKEGVLAVQSSQRTCLRRFGGYCPGLSHGQDDLQTQIEAMISALTSVLPIIQAKILLNQVQLTFLGLI